jgi:hypothetical protein
LVGLQKRHQRMSKCCKRRSNFLPHYYRTLR